jgi:hypothetical protein
MPPENLFFRTVFLPKLPLKKQEKNKPKRAAGAAIPQAVWS